MAAPTGVLAKLYVLSGGVSAPNVPAEIDTSETDANILGDTDWVEVCARDVNLDSSFDEADATDRCNAGYNATIPTTRNAEITFEAIKRKPLQQYLNILKAAADGRLLVGVLMLDDDKGTAEADGIVMNANVTNFSESQGLRDPITISFTLKPGGEAATAPRSITAP